MGSEPHVLLLVLDVLVFCALEGWREFTVLSCLPLLCLGVYCESLFPETLTRQQVWVFSQIVGPQWKPSVLMRSFYIEYRQL